MPGLINTHTHAAMVLFRSLADDLALDSWLKEKIWPLEEKLTPEDVYAGTRLAICEMLRSGTTTFADMYFFMDEVARAVEESGIRAVLARGLLGTGPEAEKKLEEAIETGKKWKGRAEGRIITMLGPHAPYTVPPEFLRQVVAASRHYQLPLHIHVAETRNELEEISERIRQTTGGISCGARKFFPAGTACPWVWLTRVRSLLVPAKSGGRP